MRAYLDAIVLSGNTPELRPEWKRALEPGRLVAAHSERLLTQPLAAFEAAWQYRALKTIPTFFWSKGMSKSHAEEAFAVIFAGALQSRCASRHWNTMSQLRGRSFEAFPLFLEELSRLLDTWKPISPDARRWSEENPAKLRQVQQAMWKKREAIAIASSLSTDGLMTLGPVALLKFADQRTYAQAARTAARALFGEYFKDLNQIKFCAKCEKPFSESKKTKYCETKCGRRATANKSHAHEKRGRNARQLLKAAEALKMWNSIQPEPDPRKYIEVRSEMAKAKGYRRSTKMGYYIRAAGEHKGSARRKELFNQLSIKELKLDGARAQQFFDKFLGDLYSILAAR